MAFIDISDELEEIGTIEELLAQTKTREVQAAWSRQADVWRKYESEHLETPDLAIQLPTGSGKTLVGSLLGEWRRKKYQEKVLYLCPTKQLVNQVVDQASRQYGLNVLPFIGPKRDYDNTLKRNYARKEGIAISTYSSLFNTNPFFESPDIIILDDAHVADNYIASMWSMTISRLSYPHIYEHVVNLLGTSYRNIDFHQMIHDEATSRIRKLPTKILIDHHQEITACFDEISAHLKDQDPGIHFRWQSIRAQLLSCHIYVSNQSILVRPLLPPSFTLSAFSNAKQRIFMSATLGHGGELERITGRKNITRLELDYDTASKGMGRRFFIFPESKFDEVEKESILSDALDIFQKGLYITPSQRASQRRTEKILTTHPECVMLSASDIEQSKDEFLRLRHAAVVVSNRYEGIDFPNDECRLLVLDGLPKAANLQEQFLIQKMGCQSLLSDRIQTRIIQSIGRCTRADLDYSLVIVTGQAWIQFLLENNNLKYLPEYIQAEIDFGERQSVTDIADIYSNMQAFQEQSDEWQAADKSIDRLAIRKNQEERPESEQLAQVVSYEIDYLQCLWQKDYVNALNQCREILAILTRPELQGYRALWSYNAAACCDLAVSSEQIPDKDASKPYYEAVAKMTITMPWLTDLVRTYSAAEAVSHHIEPGLAEMLESIESNLIRLGVKHSSRYNQAKEKIGLSLSQADAKTFEQGQVQLGKLLGFISKNEETPAAPDPWWILPNDVCIVFEDHTECTNDIFPVRKARQVAGHDNWLRKNESLVTSNHRVIKVLVTTATKMPEGGQEHLSDVYFVTPDEFYQWASDSISVVTEIRKSLTQECDLAWRAESMATLIANDLSPNDIVSFFTRVVASDYFNAE